MFIFQGPVTSRDLSVQEKLDRPIVKVFQRHPGTNLPEAQEMVKVRIYFMHGGHILLIKYNMSATLL